MLQLQYLISKLNNKQINNILDNYKLKYSGIRNEIESKINDMIKLFLKDILGFLENIEEIANKKKKLNNYEKMKNELDSIKYQLKLKAYNEHKTKNELDLLIQENSLLKVKIKSLNQKILNLNNSINNNNEGKVKSPLIRNNNTYSSKLITSDLCSKSLHYSTKLVIKYSKKYNSVDKELNLEKKNSEKLNYSKNNLTNISSIKNKSYKTNLKKENNNLEEENNNTINNSIKNSNNPSGKIKQKKINYNKYVNNKRESKINNINNINNTNNNLKKSKKDFEPLYKGPILTAMSTIINKNENEIRNSSSNSSNSNPKALKDTHNYSPNNSFNLFPELNTNYEEIGNNINSAFDEELKQLEIDEENIKRLLEQLGNGKYNNINLMKNSVEKIIN